MLVLAILHLPPLGRLGFLASGWYYWVRLPIQFIFIGWALWCAKSEDGGAPAPPER